MQFHVLTLFPGMIATAMEYSILGKARQRGAFSLNTVNIRDYTEDPHRKVDDEPYGGGAGMLMQAQPVFDAWQSVTSQIPTDHRRQTIFLSPKGERFDQDIAAELAAFDDIIFLCGHYEGIDERALEEIQPRLLSIGDYILTGGELGALVMMDAISRLLPDVLGNEQSSQAESFSGFLLEYPQYTRPPVWHDRAVPSVLLEGDAAKIRDWRRSQSEEVTKALRPDLYDSYKALNDLREAFLKERRNYAMIIDAIDRGDLLLQRTDSAGLWLSRRDFSEWFLIEQIPECLLDVTVDSLSGFHSGKLTNGSPLKQGNLCWFPRVNRAEPTIPEYVLSSWRCIGDGILTNTTQVLRQAVYTPHTTISVSKWNRAMESQRPMVSEAICSMIPNIASILESGHLPWCVFSADEPVDEAFLASFGIYLSQRNIMLLESSAPSGGGHVFSR